MDKRNRIAGIIPARYGSTRFPGKPLADINGMSMIERVYKRSKMAGLLDEVVVATDDERIIAAVEKFGGKAVMTSASHRSGTDRCLEALQRIKGSWDIVINIQGDEPLISPEQINQLARCFYNNEVQIGTLIKAIKSSEELINPGTVKVIKDNLARAIYFSRSPLPYQRDKAEQEWVSTHEYYKHIGIYGYRTETLKKIASLPQSSLEIAESLEQLRWLQNGFPIFTSVTLYDNIAVDTPDDLQVIIELLNSSKDKD
jgi:3-deoxy-manno-octulosonate cytidylyltransferase (CMP-KDO synthetase)